MIIVLLIWCIFLRPFELFHSLHENQCSINIHDVLSKYAMDVNIRSPYVMDTCKFVGFVILATGYNGAHQPMGSKNPMEPLCLKTALSAINGLHFLFSETWFRSAIIVNFLPIVLFTNKNDQINYYHIFYIHSTFFFFLATYHN